MLDLKIRRKPHYLLMEEMSPGWAFMMMQDYDRLPQDINHHAVGKKALAWSLLCRELIGVQERCCKALLCSC